MAHFTRHARLLKKQREGGKRRMQAKLSFVVGVLMLFLMLGAKCSKVTPTRIMVPIWAETPREGFPAQARGFLFTDGFESGDLSAWSFVWRKDCWAIETNPAYVHSGYHSARVHYLIGADAPEHHDDNEFIQYNFEPPVTKVFVRGYVYHRAPNPGGAGDIQRKIYYLKDAQGPKGTPPYHWAVVLTSDNMVMRLNLFGVASERSGGHDKSYWDLFTLKYNTWYCIEMEVEANSPGLRDGTVRVWVDGKKMLENTALNIRDSYSTGADKIEIGRQADRVNHLPVDEYRYWDDIAISDQYIGPLTTSSTRSP